jgi:TatD DNase family protein
VNKYADTHCHLNFDLFTNDLEEILHRAQTKGIYRILVPGSDFSSSKLAVELAKRYSEIYAAVGVHPNDISTWDSTSLSKLDELCREPKVVAIGEIGLDLYRNPSSLDLQKEVLDQQLSLAARHHLPVLLHNRKSSLQMIEILRNYSVYGIFHAFNGDENILAFALQNGFHFGIGGTVTYPKTALNKDMLLEIKKYCILETDSPFLSPNPFRGDRNEPANIQVIAEFMAKILEISVESLAKITSNNANKIFGWDQ